MSYYHPKGAELQPHIRRMTIALIQGYDTMVGELNDAVTVSVENDGQPKGSTVGDPTYQAYIRRVSKGAGVKAIDNALQTLPPEYREVTLQWVKSGRPLYEISGSELAHLNTWTKQKEKLITQTAINMGWC